MQDKSRYMDSGDGTVYDSTTSLTWMQKDSWLDMEREVSWDEAHQYAKQKNEEKFGGHSDWRLPTLQEALSLFQKEKFNKDSKGGDIHIDPVFLPGAGNCTWTSSTRGREAQIIFYLNGFAYWYEKDDKTLSHAVRLVRR